MNIDQLIEELQTIKSKYGNLTVTLDDLYTEACLPVDWVNVQQRGDSVLNENVVVIRD
jgi:hypothetical protein